MENLQADSRQAIVQHRQVAGGLFGQIDGASGDERPPVIDADHRSSAVSQIGDLEQGAEGQAAVSGGS
jgi:hypothetical protein